MPEFRKISECDDPMEVLGAPMEVGLIPEPCGVWGGWDVDYDEPFEGERARFPHEDIRSELFDRYTAALKLSSGDEQGDLIYLEDLEGAFALEVQVRRILSTAYSGLQLATAMRSYERDQSYEAMTRRQRSRFDKIAFYREAGYKLPRSPAELVKFGTKKNRRPGVSWQAPRPIARKVARKILLGESTSEAIEAGITRSSDFQKAVNRGGKDIRIPPKDERLLEDSIKTIVGAPWPKAVFDGCEESPVLSNAAKSNSPGRLLPRYRYVIFHQVAQSAFKDAFRNAVLKRVAIVGDHSSGGWMAAPKPL